MNLLNEMKYLIDRIVYIISHPYANIIALGLISIWIISGPFFNYSTTWQLIANTFTTLVTFYIGFIIQYTQNRDSRAIHVKLDELLRVIADARNQLIDIEHADDNTLKRVEYEVKDSAL